MIPLLQLWVAPATTAVLLVWAAALGFAGEAEPELPQLLARQLPSERSTLTARGLQVAHLTVMALAALVGGTALAWWAWGPLQAATRFLLVVALVWLVGDLLPRVMAALAPDQTGPARRLALRTLQPFAPLFALVTRLARRLAPAAAGPEPAVALAQRDMLLGVFSLADMTVSDVMTPRIDIVAVDMRASAEEVVGTLRSSEHARLVVYDDSPDQVVGILYAKDMLAALGAASGDGWDKLIRPAAFVPEAKTLDRQLRDFQRGPAHIAVVVDEFGGTAGIVTLEDILEEIVGEIKDEYDTDEVAPIQRIGEDRLVVQGGVPLAELEDALDHRFERDDVSTVGGLVLAELGRVPRSGEVLEVQGIRMQVDQVVRRRVRRVSVTLAPAVPAGEAAEGAE